MTEGRNRVSSGSDDPLTVEREGRVGAPIAERREAKSLLSGIAEQVRVSEAVGRLIDDIEGLLLCVVFQPFSDDSRHSEAARKLFIAMDEARRMSHEEPSLAEPMLKMLTPLVAACDLLPKLSDGRKHARAGNARAGRSKRTEQLRNIVVKHALALWKKQPGLTAYATAKAILTDVRNDLRYVWRMTYGKHPIGLSAVDKQVRIFLAK